MLQMLATIGRALAQHWPALLALHLGGILARYVLIELSGWVGAHSAVAGLLLLPLAVLARLAAFVGMFLVLRPSLRQLSAIAPPPTTPEERRSAFIASLLGGVLPFFAVYAATGNIRQDVVDYSARALEVLQGYQWNAAVEGATHDASGTVTDVLLSPVSVIVIILALAARWAWGRWEARLPRWLSLVAVYIEGVWVFISLLLLQQFMPAVSAWVEDRRAMVWLADARAWAAETVAPVAWAWDGIDWALGVIGGALGQPLAWLTIAGVMYGQAVAAQAPDLSRHWRDPRLAGTRARVDAARARFGALPEWLRVQLAGLWASFSGRVMPIWRAIVLMLRGGPVVIGATVLLFAVVEWLEGGLAFGITRLVGAQGLHEFWGVWDLLLLLPVTLIVEPLRIALIAGAYDATIDKLRERKAADAAVATSTPTTDAAARDAIAGPAPAPAELPAPAAATTPDPV